MLPSAILRVHVIVHVFLFIFFFHLAQTILKTAANPRRHYLEICLVSQKLKAVP